MTAGDEMSNPSMKQSIPASPHLFGLDGIRALSISLVVGYHISHYNFDYQPWMKSASSIGNFGVEIFFALSGFLITWLLIREHERLGRIDFRAFYIRRAIRILPPAYFYLAVLGILTAAGVISTALHEYTSSAFFFRNWMGGGSTFTGHFWSLSIEEQFYLFWPALAFGLPKKFRIPLTLALCAFAPAWRHINTVYLDTQNWARTDLRYDALLWGALLAFLWYRESVREFFTTSPWRNGILAVASVAVMVVTFILESIEGIPGMVVVGIPTTRYLMVCVFMAAVANGRAGLISRFLDSRPAAWFGALSYSLYIWQQVFCFPSAERNPEGKMWINEFPNNLVLSLAAATLSFYLVEAPFRKLRARFRP